MAGCFALAVFLVSCDSRFLWLFLTVPRVGLQCAIVVFPDHTHLFFFSCSGESTMKHFYKLGASLVCVIDIQYIVFYSVLKSFQTSNIY